MDGAARESPMPVIQVTPVMPMAPGTCQVSDVVPKSSVPSSVCQRPRLHRKTDSSSVCVFAPAPAAVASRSQDPESVHSFRRQSIKTDQRTGPPCGRHEVHPERTVSPFWHSAIVALTLTCLSAFLLSLEW
jgi:hypothetical protein